MSKSSSVLEPSKNGHSNGVAARPDVVTVNVEIPAIQKTRVVIRIVGDSPLLMHAWSEKARGEMRTKQTLGAKTKKAPKDANAEMAAATYFIDQKKSIVGFPVLAFKAAMVDAAVALGAKKTETRRAFHIIPDAKTPQGELVTITYESMVQREDMVRIGIAQADLRYRPEFHGWSADLTFRYDARQTSPQQLISLLNQAGFSTGVGEWRPERDGQHGMFSVDSIVGDVMAEH